MWSAGCTTIIPHGCLVSGGLNKTTLAARIVDHKSKLATNPAAVAVPAAAAAA